MEKKYKVNLKFERNAERYKVVKIVGPKVVVHVREGNNITQGKVRVGDMLTEPQTEVLGERALLTTQ